MNRTARDLSVLALYVDCVFFLSLAVKAEWGTAAQIIVILPVVVGGMILGHWLGGRS